jgi:manganese/zinc/iron transport system permease protein
MPLVDALPVILAAVEHGADAGASALPGIWEAIGRFVSLRDANVRWVLLGSALLGLAGGALGAFALLRRRALLGDALAHAALPGVCLAFLVTGSKDPVALLAGAAVTGTLGTLAIGAITRHSRVKEDAALGLVLSVFFGVGIMLLTWIQKHPSGDPSGLDRFIFGQAASMLPADLELMAWLTAGLGVAVWLLFKELKLVSFDPQYGAALGFPVRGIEFLLAGMIVLAVVVGLQAVGVVLMAAMLVVPPAAARQWTDRLGVMVTLSAAFGAASGLLGSFASFLAPHLPTGPVMVLAAAMIFVVSLLFAPRRGLVVAALRATRNRRRVRRENILKTLYNLEERRVPEGEPLALTGSTAAELAEVRRMGAARIERALARLASKGLVGAPGAAPAGSATGQRWTLTPAGLREARRLVRSHRLWEVYLVEQAHIAHDHVHRDAEDAEHVLEPEIIAELEERLGSPMRDVHGRTIPEIDEPAPATPGGAGA